MITVDYVLKKGTQSNKQARICVLCGAFCSHTALPRAKGMHQPRRDSAVFFSKQTATAAMGDQRMCIQRAGTGGEGQKKGGSSSSHSALSLLRPPVRHRFQVLPPHDTTYPPFPTEKP